MLKQNPFLPSEKAGRFEKLLGFDRSHSIVTRGSVSRAPSRHFLSVFLNLNGTRKLKNQFWASLKSEQKFQVWKHNLIISILIVNHLNKPGSPALMYLMKKWKLNFLAWLSRVLGLSHGARKADHSNLCEIPTKAI